MILLIIIGLKKNSQTFLYVLKKTVEYNNRNLWCQKSLGFS